MTTVQDLHERAMAAADDMLAARRNNRRREADRAATSAFRAELDAATMAFDLNVSAVTRIVLLRSLANLAQEARTWRDAMDLAVRALTAEDLTEHRDEIFGIVDSLRAFEHLDIRGVVLSDSDIQLSVAGPEVAPGFARLDDVTRRVENVTSLVLRTAMRKAKIPYEEGIPRAQAFRSTLTPYISQGRAASFAVTLRFGLDEQRELGLTEAREGKSKRRRAPQVSKVLEDVIASAQAYAEGGPDAIRRLVKDEKYAANAMTLLRHLSPDSKRINVVGLTVVRGGHATPVALPDRDRFNKPPVALTGGSGRAQALPPKQLTVEGRLLQGNATRPRSAKAAIVDAAGDIVQFGYDEASHGDIIKSYWKHLVRAKLRREGATRLFLLDLDDA